MVSHPEAPGSARESDSTHVLTDALEDPSRLLRIRMNKEQREPDGPRRNRPNREESGSWDCSTPDTPYSGSLGTRAATGGPECFPIQRSSKQASLALLARIKDSGTEAGSPNLEGKSSGLGGRRIAPVRAIAPSRGNTSP